MISEKMIDAINKQINAEMYSAYLYLSMSEFFKTTSFKGFATWMSIQTIEETIHADKFRLYLNDQNGKVVLTQIDAPPTEWTSPLAVFEAVLAHEKKVTALIHELMTLARMENDYASEFMLQWFITEQIEEEASAQDIVDRVKQIKDAPQAMFMLDEQLGARPMPTTKADGSPA
jgi:ferritin